eukprot:TRINITY_DN2941_c2_g3_i1.p4 TRINITY_DN2941_c2_g3~~TRINITY_DN2941_c2_g3_i1.p4  ORF type:complete len:189 (-),score=-20.15 TRINITY_DN2941_c2_g3_i1:231-797(-)
MLTPLIILYNNLGVIFYIIVFSYQQTLVIYTIYILLTFYQKYIYNLFESIQILLVNIYLKSFIPSLLHIIIFKCRYQYRVIICDMFTLAYLLQLLQYTSGRIFSYVKGFYYYYYYQIIGTILMFIENYYQNELQNLLPQLQQYYYLIYSRNIILIIEYFILQNFAESGVILLQQLFLGSFTTNVYFVN